MAKSRSKPRRRFDAAQGRRTDKRSCKLCKERDGYIDYKDVTLLKKYTSDRAKIRSSRVTSLCPQCQRKVSTAVKNAREMALLPYIPTHEGRPGVKR